MVQNSNGEEWIAVDSQRGIVHVNSNPTRVHDQATQQQKASKGRGAQNNEGTPQPYID